MDPVADQFGKERIGCKHRAQDAWLAMIEGSHGVEGMGGGGGSGLNAGDCFGGFGVGVAEGDADVKGGAVADEVEGSGCLGGDGDEADVAAGGGVEASFWVDFKLGYEGGTKLVSPLVTAGSLKGMHGYFPTHPEMRATFMIDGPGLAAFIETLPIAKSEKARLQQLKPQDYVGLAAELARKLP